MIRYAGLFANRRKKQYLFHVNVHFVDMFGASPDIAFCALRSFLRSKRDTHLDGNATIAIMG
jgi:hypothetical protein